MYFADGMLMVNAIFSIRFLYVQREGRIEIAILGGSDEQIPPHAATIAFGFPLWSYVPTTNTGSGYATARAPKELFIGIY